MLRPPLLLDANEGPPLSASDFQQWFAEIDADMLRRYPRSADLEARIAQFWNVAPNRIIVTNGGDDAINRVCLSLLEHGRDALIHDPTFEMIAVSAQLAGGTMRSVPWFDGPFPIEQFRESITDATRLVALVSPNNPTGSVIATPDILAVVDCAQSHGAVVLVDLAYVEFADEDPTARLLELDNVIIIRTFSKARSLAGLRVGYAIAPPGIATWLRSVGSPYPVSSISLAIAAGNLGSTDANLSQRVTLIRRQRLQLTSLLIDLGSEPIASQSNFVLARFNEAEFCYRALASLGIGVRAFEGRRELENCLRITLPGDEEEFAQLSQALKIVCQPEAILFDLDGVLADVSQSYRRAIIETARSYGVEISPQEISAAKARGCANNDWILTHKLLNDRRVDAALSEVTQRFQSRYLGTGQVAGLRETESLLADRAVLGRLSQRFALAVVTGRPRAEAEWFLTREGLTDTFTSMVCMEDGPAKPSPDPVRLAMSQLGVTRAWMVGDTPDDIRAAIDAGLVPIGIADPSNSGLDVRSALDRCGAARILPSVNDMESLLP